MINFTNLYKETITQFENLENFINHIKNEHEYYSVNREILYTGVINRCYSLWETYNKNAVYYYYLKVKDKLIESNKLIEKLKLHELPGYIVEQGKFHPKDNYVYYDLKEELITYTSKNMDINQLNTLYDRVGINILENLYSNTDIKYFLSNQTGDFNKDIELKKALKDIIIERNSTAHSASISTYKNLSFIEDWIKLYKLLIREITIIICNEIAKNQELFEKTIGEYKKYVKHMNVICLDLYDDVYIDRNSLLGIVKNNKMVDIVKAISFQIDNNNKNEARGNEKVGIKLVSYFDKTINITENNKIILL